ncbi:MAG: hypothetical protein GY814_05770 [Gammaproteobacteria bacterium]|nr:hypothetical protein [Gammaproteobacteria bacterium]
MHIPFTAQPGILSCEILQIKDVQLGITEHHGLVSIQPSSAGQWFIQHLRSQRLHNKLMLGREYFARTGGVKAQFSEGDRRRKHLQIEKVGQINVQAKGMEQFVQTYLS